MGLRTKNHCDDEPQQQFSSQSVAPLLLLPLNVILCLKIAYLHTKKKYCEEAALLPLIPKIQITPHLLTPPVGLSWNHP
jgi:hypothetical protein